jgi:Ni/Co efflux regulator RcnB
MSSKPTTPTAGAAVASAALHEHQRQRRKEYGDHHQGNVHRAEDSTGSQESQETVSAPLAWRLGASCPVRRTDL